ncbi:hypothetical protein T492DRAFT_467006 [Pavlovales sp. CCMP2436]|nr:hypothetical protein T492DRAFT_467006 [Pavlovales sp. CCMP2436]
MQAPKRWIPLSRSSAPPCNRSTQRARLRRRARRGRLAQDRGPRRPVRALLARRARGGSEAERVLGFCLEGLLLAPTCSCAWLAGRPRRASPFVLFALNSSQTMPSPMNVNGKAPMAKCSHCTMQLLASNMDKHHKTSYGAQGGDGAQPDHDSLLKWQTIGAAGGRCVR